MYLYSYTVGILSIGDNMLQLSEDILRNIKNTKYKVYSKEPLRNGVECYNSIKSFDESDNFYITHISADHIKCDDNRFYYTEESMCDVADFWPKQILNIGTSFVKSKKKDKLKCVSQVSDNEGTVIKSNSCIIDASGLPAFNEDLSVYEYRLYLTLFNEYTVKQCRYDRHDLYDAKFKSSKYDLQSKIQNSDFLKSKDFVMINSCRQKNESVPVGIIIKENSDDDKYNLEYGTVYINMDNIVSIKWH